jgi:hypothetical protein
MRYLSGVVLISLMLMGCGTPRAPDYSGRWQPVNGYTQSVKELPLRRPYYFQALPVDLSLKELLARWGREGNANLVYQAAKDFSLSLDVAQIKAASLEEAVVRIDAIYRPYDIQVLLTPERQLIVVSSVTNAAESGAAVRVDSILRNRRIDPALIQPAAQE